MRKIITLFIITLSININAQSPWTKEKGKVYSQISYTSIANYNTLFGDPEYNISGTISDNTIQLYNEYGISDKTTLLVNLPFKNILFEKNTVCLNTPCKTIKTSKFGLGNIEFGVKHNFYNNKWLISGQMSVEANTSSNNANEDIVTGYNAWTFTPLLLVGKSFNKTYLQAFIGGNIRTNNYSSNFKIGGEYGGKILNKLWLIGFIDIVKSLENGNIQLPINNTLSGLYLNDQEYGAFGFKVIKEFSDKNGITGGFGGAFFGNNVAKSPALSIGMYHKF